MPIKLASRAAPRTPVQVKPLRCPMITVFGEAVVDLVSAHSTSLDLCHAVPGGSPANVAVGLARLEVPTAFAARLGSDPFARLMRDHLDRSGVDGRFLVQASQPSTLALATLGQDGAAGYDFWVDGTADWQWSAGELPDPLPSYIEALHTGSLAMALPPGANALEDLLVRENHRGQTTISLDPNCRPALMGDPEQARDRIERQIALADIVKVSDEDLEWLCPGEPITHLASRWIADGPTVVVVTLGSGGAYGRLPDAEVFVPAAPVAPIDTIGAGDAFTAGLLEGFHAANLLGAKPRARLRSLTREDFTRILTRAALIAARTCERSGADPPTRREVDQVRTAEQSTGTCGEARQEATAAPDASA